MIALLIAQHIIFSLLSYGVFMGFAYRSKLWGSPDDTNTRMYEDRHLRRLFINTSIAVSMFGLVSLIIVLSSIKTFKYGIKLTIEEKESYYNEWFLHSLWYRLQKCRRTSVDDWVGIW